MEPLLFKSSTNHEAALKTQYLDAKMADLPTPAAILDSAVIRKNCQLMLTTASKLNIQFRAHIKTHKTIQATKLQVGETGAVRLVISTIAELELVAPWLKECIGKGREVSVLYGVPAAPSSVSRVARIARELGGAGYVAFMVDHPETLDMIAKHQADFEGSVPVYIKIDTGYGRAGVKPNSNTLKAIRGKLVDPSISQVVAPLGTYSHFGHSYGFSTPLESLEGLLTEFELLRSVAETTFKGTKLTLSVGATPTATAAQMLADSAEASQVAGSDNVRSRWEALKNSPHTLEIHAGVYPFLDMQQLATQARISNLTESNFGFRVLVEVASIYSEREKPEALIAAGSLALGREPCKSYSGWGIVSPWSSVENVKDVGYFTTQNKTGWIVGRISQEHGILTWEGDAAGKRDLQIGEKLLIWPNHACITGAGFGWYYVVDSDVDGGETVQDVWVRCRGW
jgi:D-serine deaminase-like pyridoxal phosphate-dependent protein